jgi:hypothetical protein
VARIAAAVRFPELTRAQYDLLIDDFEMAEADDQGLAAEWVIHVGIDNRKWAQRARHARTPPMVVARATVHPGPIRGLAV